MLLPLSASSASVALNHDGSKVSRLRAVNLLVDHLENPIGLDSAKPSFGWRLEAIDPSAHDLSQTAYQIVVASSAGFKGGLWDTGRIDSARTCCTRLMQALR
jgi:alpha-L-rhamnosidase